MSKNKLFPSVRIFTILAMLLTLCGIGLNTNAVYADNSKSSTPKTLYFTDTEFKEKMIKAFGPEAANARQVKKTVNFDSIDPSMPQWITSPNWCGYKLNNGTAPIIKGVITQFPARHCTGYDAVDASWIGLSDFWNLLQAGVNMKTMKAWIEQLPGGVEQDVFSVSAGDDIHISIGYDYAGYYLVSLWDQTSQVGWAVDRQFSPATNCCEWVTETLWGHHIGTFSPVNYSFCKWWDASLTYYNMNTPGTSVSYTLNDYFNETMSPSPIGADNSSFSIQH